MTSATTLDMISRVAIIDDEPEARYAYEFVVEDAHFQSDPIEGPLGSLTGTSRVESVRQSNDAALCDFQLDVRGSYADFTGAQLVAHWYEEGFPSILCTRYEKIHIERIRPYRRWIPVLIKPDELSTEALHKGFERCLSELKGEFTADRRPWRTQVHFLRPDDEQPDTFLIELPAWEVRELLRVRLSDLPSEVRTQVRDDFRCHVRANLAATQSEELFLCGWTS